jgi:mannose-6-phosphate isomerase-like protein (cupin superfamily)
MAPETFPHPSEGGNVNWETLMSCGRTDTDTFTAGIAMCPPAASTSCPTSHEPDGIEAGHLKLHRHIHAEMYHVTAGKGVVSIDGLEHVVEKGSVVFIPGDVEHDIRDTGTGDLVWLYVFAANGFSDEVGKIKRRERAKF